MDSARAIAVRLVGLGSPSPEPAAGRPGRMRRHCRAPDRSVPSPTGRPRQSVALATPPSDAGLPQTTRADAVRGGCGVHPSVAKALKGIELFIVVMTEPP